MNILFIYNLENKDYYKITCRIEEGINDLIKDTIINIDRRDKINVKTKTDIYIILSDESQEVDMYFEKIKNKNKVIVLTNNLSSSNILNAVRNTKNVCYMNNDVRILITKIYNVYLENK